MGSVELRNSFLSSE